MGVRPGEKIKLSFSALIVILRWYRDYVEFMYVRNMYTYVHAYTHQDESHKNH